MKAMMKSRASTSILTIARRNLSRARWRIEKLSGLRRPGNVKVKEHENLTAKRDRVSRLQWLLNAGYF